MFVVIRRCGDLLALATFIALSSGMLRAQIAPTNTATISGSVIDGSGKAIVGAKVSLSGLKLATTKTDAQGFFVFVGVPFGTYNLAAAAAGFGTVTRSNVSVQSDMNVAIQYDTNANGMKVIANVSSSSTAHFNITPASITQVNPMSNAFEGKTSWRTILEQIPGVSEAGLGNGAYPTAAIPDSPQATVQISIDGALPYETATLFDDMALISAIAQPGMTPVGTGTQLNAYSLNSFSSADIIRGPGADAPSIVNSIGGSFVLHAPGAVSQSHYDASFSTDPYGGFNGNFQAALRLKKLSIVATYGIWTSPGPITGTGVSAIALGPATVNGQSFSYYSYPSVLYNTNYSGPYGAPFLGYGNSFLVDGVPQQTGWVQHSGSIALTYAISPSVIATLFYSGDQSNVPNASALIPTLFDPPAGYTGSLEPGMSNFFCTGTGYAPVHTTQATSLLEEKIAASAGGGILKLAALQNRTFSTSSLVTPSSGSFQLFGAAYLNGSTTPTYFNGGTYTFGFNPCTLLSGSTVNNRDLLASYTKQFGSVHAGASFVQSFYNNPQYNDDYYGVSYDTVLPSAISQTTDEIRLFVGGNPTEKTSLDLSSYFVNANYHIPDPNAINSYQTPGAVFNYADSNFTYAAPRLGFVWRPNASLSIRAAAGGGFAEAPLSDLVGSNAPSRNYSSTLGYFYESRPPGINLQPEKSFAFTVGADKRFSNGLIASLDVYNAVLQGQLYQSYINGGMYTGIFGTLPLYIQKYENLGTSRYEGVLVNIRRDVPRGTFWSVAGGLTRGYVASVPAGFYNGTGVCNFVTTTNCTNLNVVPGINFNGTYTVGDSSGAAIPYAQGHATLGYRWGADKYVDLVGTYYGNNNSYLRPAFAEFDGDASYPLTKNLSLQANFRNITGIYDSPYQIYSNSSFLGVPSVAGLPWAEYGEEFGPRTVVVTLQAHF